MGRKTITAAITDYIEDIKGKSQCTPLAPPANATLPVTCVRGRWMADR